jgi:nitroimidazol reductase NimA-like FMN-containing flavoprotein (pyridoxamine 5'-phosphate oxidase superfamily)
MRLVDEGLELLDEEECRRLLARCSVGRVGLSVNSLPAIFPVNYRMVGDSIVFATGPGMKLNAANARDVIAFEVDEIDEGARGGWSVLVVGVASELDAPTRQLCAAMDPWAGGDRRHLVRITTDLVSGRRLVPGS